MPDNYKELITNSLANNPWLLIGMVAGKMDYWYESIPKFIQDSIKAVVVGGVVVMGQYYTVKSDLRNLNTNLVNEIESRKDCCEHVHKRIDNLQKLHTR